MFQQIACLTFALAGLLAVSTTARGQQPAPPAAEVIDAEPLLTGNPRLLKSLERISKGSALWRSEVEALRGTGRRAVILTAEQVVVADPANGGRPRSFDPAVLAEVAVLPGEDSGFGAVLVVVNLSLLDDIHDRKGLFRREREADLDRILVHEVYGHALPYLTAGDASGRCADPVAGERPTNACSIRRENAVRAELGLGRRTDYGLSGLTLGLPTTTGLNDLILAQHFRH